MKKINNKGITTIEVLISFILIVIITMSLFSTVNSFNEKRVIESYKEKIYTYKNTLTKTIQDDFIKIGITNARIEGENNKLVCNLKDGTDRELVIEDETIKYGNPNDNDLIEYPVPNLGNNNTLNISKEIKIIDGNVLKIHIEFSHSELETKYAIDIVSPINYTFSGQEADSE